jgi:hypothetical protein
MTLKLVSDKSGAEDLTPEVFLQGLSLFIGGLRSQTSEE